MGSIPEATELYYEARAFAGSEASPRTPGAPSLSAGLGVRWGGGPVQATISGFWGPRPDLDFKMEYAGYARFGPVGVRATAGLVLTRDATRGRPEWTEGFCGGIDIGYAKHWEVFLYFAQTDHYLPGWLPNHGVLQTDFGGRYMGRHFGVELRGTPRFGYEQGATYNLSLSFVARMSLDREADKAIPTTPLDLIGREADDL